MPITPPYEWREAETSVSVDIKIRAVTPSSADILMTDCYAKVNCAPYYFEADLYGEIDPRKSSASVGQDTIKFFFIKKESGLWGRLSLPGDRKMILDRRHRSLAIVREQAQKDREDFPAKVSNIGRLAVGEQMKLEEGRRKAIEQKKNEELRTEQESLKTWMASNAWQSITDADTTDISDGLYSEVAEETVGMSNGRMRQEDFSHTGECLQLGRRSSTSDVIDSFKKSKDPCRQTAATNWLPAPRRNSSIPITFSVKPDRPVHLPARESRDKVQLKKKESANPEASNSTEREPLFLLDKADKFFRCGDYRSAINAYTSALEADPSLLLLQLGQYLDCAKDCCQALNLLQHVMPTRDLPSSPNSKSPHSDATPELCPQSLTEQISFSRLELFECLKGHAVDEDAGLWEAGVKEHVLLLRATAKYHEGKLQQALEDYAQALQFKPTHKDIESIVTHIKRLLQSDSSRETMSASQDVVSAGM